MLKIKKIGHSGTLDPDATGVLLILIQKATKALPYLQDHDKSYHATMYLGKTTDTYDAGGKVTSESDAIVSDEQISETILHFIGKQKQLPPMYSAKKVDGKKLYELARKGIEVERKPSDIEIYGISIEEISFPRVSFSVDCSEGTYIRSLIHDMGQQLGCGAYMESLRRTKASGYLLKDAHTLEEIQKSCDDGSVSDLIIPLCDLFPYKKYVCDPSADTLLNNGNSIDLKLVSDSDAKEGEYLRLLRSDGAFVGIYRRDHSVLRLEKFFLEEP